MSWLEDIQNNRKRQVEQMAKAFGYDNFTIQKARAEDDGVDYTVDEPEEEEETLNKSQEDKTYAGKSDMYKMRMLGLRKFNDQDQKEYIGVEDADNSYITNLENGDIIISKIAEGYLVSKFPVDTENEEGDEQEVTDLSEAIDVALQFKDDLEDVKEPEQIMYKETEKAFEDEINPFEKETWKASLSKAELDEFEKAKHADGDMHPNGKWVWRSSANGGKGDWRVAKKGSSSTSGGGSSKSAGVSGGSDKKSKKEFLSQNDKTSIRNVVKGMFRNNLTSLSFTTKDELIVNVEGKAYGDGYDVWCEWELKDGNPTGGGYSGDTRKSRMDELMKKLGKENLKKLKKISLNESYD